jgi:hypothetical protein
MPQLIGVLHSSDVENKSLTALPPQLTEALRGNLKLTSFFCKKYDAFVLQNEDAKKSGGI